MTTWVLRKPSISSRILHHIRGYRVLYRFSIGVVLFTLFVQWLQFTWLTAFLSTFVIYLVSGGWRFVRLIYLTLPRDLRGAIFMFKVTMFIRKIKKKNQTVSDLFKETVQKHGNKVAFIFEDKQWTFQEVDSYSNQVANYFQSIGYKKGDVVALFMENRPELVFFWLGLSKIGVISALVNYNLKKEPLSHSVSIVNSKGLIYSEAVADILLYIYTSGTTGHPKACVIRHSRFCFSSMGLCTGISVSSKDVMYCVLPLYHTSAGITGVGAALIFGATMAVRKKFSASQFWNDCIKYRATYIPYIGELCRYLLAQPVKETDKMHSLRLAYGNGLRPQIWKEFQTRFNIPLICELYGSTEGNTNLLNFTGYPGAVGFLPVILPQKYYPIRLFKMDFLTDELLRGPDGLCVPCNPGEVGQIVGRIDKRHLTGRFDGYLDKKATNKKIAQDVAKKGDQWFLAGDTLYWDELGYLFFHDRLGDTFRWRGENVSTTEVEGIIVKILGLNSVVVFGVEIPGCEGRAGMAAIEDPDHVIHIEFLGKQLSDSLPSYARPMFLRITNSVDTTGTFKFQKSRLRKEGFNFSIISDKLFYLDQKNGEYRVLSENIYRKFLNGEMRI